MAGISATCTHEQTTATCNCASRACRGHALPCSAPFHSTPPTPRSPPHPAGSAPSKPATPSLASGATNLTATFACPDTDWNNVASYTYTLTRTDVAATVLTNVALPKTSIIRSSGSCSFAVQQTAIAAANNRGTFKIAVVRVAAAPCTLRCASPACCASCACSPAHVPCVYPDPTLTWC